MSKSKRSLNMRVRNLQLLIIGLCCLLPVGAGADETDTTASRFITLGTNSGPVPNPDRAEPSNVLLYDDQVIVLDAGDAVTWQLARAGVFLPDVDAIFLSHLHFDHTGGLFALIGQRIQMNVPDPFTVYGPVGTKATVEGLIKAMAPVLEDHGWMLSRVTPDPREVIKIIEVTHGSNFDIGRAKVTVSKNSHYILAEEEGDSRVRGLSFRFDLPDRSLVYTGDTGPSDDVIRLAKNVDLLVAEIMDPEESWERLEKMVADTDPGIVESVVIKFASGAVKKHFDRQHLSPEEVATLAHKAQVKTLVITHNAIADELLDAAVARIRKVFDGELMIAQDLQSF